MQPHKTLVQQLDELRKQANEMRASERADVNEVKSGVDGNASRLDKMEMQIQKLILLLGLQEEMRPARQPTAPEQKEEEKGSWFWPKWIS